MNLPFKLDELKAGWYIRVLYKQTHNYIDVGGGSIPVKRAVTIGDFKSCDKSVIFELRRGRDSLVFDRQIIDYDTFTRAFRAAVDRLPNQVANECGTPGAPEVYATMAWFLDPLDTPFNYSLIKDTQEFNSPNELGAPVAYDFGIDIDWSENGWLAGSHGFEYLADFVRECGRKLGVKCEVVAGKGFQVRVTLLDIHLALYAERGVDWVNYVWRYIYTTHLAIATRLVEEYDKVRIVFDRKFYDRARVTRLTFSIHGGVRGFTIPLSPAKLETLSERELRKLQQDINYVRHVAEDYVGSWGVVETGEGYLNALEFFNNLIGIKWGLPKKPQLTRTRWSVSGGWVTYCGYQYDRALSGWGWVRFMIKNKVCLSDGRLALSYLVFPVLVAGGPRDKAGNVYNLGVTYEDIVEYLRECLQVYPRKSIEEYLDKLESNLRTAGKYNLPLFESILCGRRKDGFVLSPLYTFRGELLERLGERGVLRRVV